MKPLLTLQECSQVFEKAYLHGAAFAVAAFFLGAWGFSILVLLLLLAVLFLALGTMHNRLERVEKTKETTSKDESKSVMPRDGETTEWLSHTLVRIWTSYRASMEQQISQQLQHFLDYNKPTWVDSFTTQGLELGPLAPEINHVWVLSPRKSGNLEMDLLIDVSFLLPGLQWDMTATLHPVKVNVPLQVRDLILKGKMLMKFRFQAKIPYVEKMWISFAGQPDFHFSSKVLNLLQMNDVPVLRTFLDNLIRDSLKLNMVHPQRWLIDMNSIWHGDEPEETEVEGPIGILVAHFPTTQGSIMQDSTGSLKSSPTASSFRSLPVHQRPIDMDEDSPFEVVEDEDVESPLAGMSVAAAAAEQTPLVQSVHRADMRLTCWLAPFTGDGRRTLLIRSLSEKVQLILKANTDDGREIWSTAKSVQTENLMSQPTRLVFNVKGRSLAVEVKLYLLRSPSVGHTATSFDIPNIPAATMATSSDSITTSVSTTSAPSGSESSTKVNSITTSETDLRNFRKKIDDKMSNMVGNTLRSLVRSRDKVSALESFVIRATQILKSISIPAKVFNKARGIVVMSMHKVGLVLGVRSGAGILTVRDEDGWSAPTGLWIGGMSAGLEGGTQSVDIIVVINNDEGMEAFTKRVLVLGMDVNLLPGPVSDEDAVGSQYAPLFWYTFNKGLSMSLSLRGTFITEHIMLNRRFYGRNVRAAEILQSRPLRDLSEVQQLHATLQDIDSITSADVKAAPQRFLDLSSYSGSNSEDCAELGGVVFLTVQTVTDVILADDIELSCLVHRDARLVAQCRLDRQGAGEWTVDNAAVARLQMIVHNTTCCILQLTVVKETDGTRQVVGSTAMDVYTCLNSVESSDGKIVLQLGPSLSHEDQHTPLKRDMDIGNSSGDEEDMASSGPPSGPSSVQRPLANTKSVSMHEPCHRTDSTGSSPRLGGHVMRTSKVASDTDACANHTAHTAEWFYCFVHQNALCRDFKHHLRTFQNCFMVRELIDQLTTHRHFEDRQSAVAFLQTMLPSTTDEGVIHPVGGESTSLDDKKTTLRFYADEMTGTGKSMKDRKYNIPGFSHDESTTVHWQKWVSRRDGGGDLDVNPMDSKSDKLIKRSFEAAKEIIMRNKKKDGDIMLPQVHCTISFRRAEGLALDLDEENSTFDDFFPYHEVEDEEEDLPFLQHRGVGVRISNPAPGVRDNNAAPAAAHANMPMISQLMADSLIQQQPPSMTQDQVISLTVMIKQGRNLKPKGGMCDAYIKVRVENEKVYRTKTIKKSATPVWDEEFKVKMISRLNGSLDFQVKDWNPISDDTALGSATLYLDSYFGQQDIKGLMSKTVHLPLQQLPSKKPGQGQLTLRLTAQPGIR
eukprot:scpid12103/ scgid2545/ SH3 domain-containing protein PJ696.02